MMYSLQFDSTKKTKGDELNESYKKAPQKVVPPSPKPPPAPPPPPTPKPKEKPDK